MLRAGGTAQAIFNAANEIAVEAFLAGALPFSRITDVIEATLDAIPSRPVGALEDVLEADRLARGAARAVDLRPA